MDDINAIRKIAVFTKISYIGEQTKKTITIPNAKGSKNGNGYIISIPRMINEPTKKNATRFSNIDRK